MTIHDKFSNEYNDALRSTRNAAYDLGYDYFDTRHLLFGLAQTKQGMAADILRVLGITDQTLLVTDWLAPRGKLSVRPDLIRPDILMERTMEHAVRTAVENRQDAVGTADLLLGMVRSQHQDEKPCEGLQVLADFNITTPVLASLTRAYVVNARVEQTNLQHALEQAEAAVESIKQQLERHRLPR